MCRWEGSPSRLGALALLWWAANTRLRPAFARRNLAFFGQCRPEAWRPAEGPENETGLTVLQATVGHSGTTSMSAALHLLGLRSFHSDDVLVYLPELFFPRRDVAALLRSCRVEAVALQHWLELNFELIERSPGVKVILVEKGYDKFVSGLVRHTANEQNSITRAMSWALDLLCHWLPWGVVWPESSLGYSNAEISVTSIMQEMCHIQIGRTGVRDEHNTMFEAVPYKRWSEASGDPNWENFTGKLYRDMPWSRELYAWYHGAIKHVVPPERLLLFDMSRHGWDELAAFVGRPRPPAGTPFPRRRSWAYPHPTTIYWKDAPGRFLAFWLALLASVVLNAAVFWLACRLAGLVAAAAAAAHCAAVRHSVGAAAAALAAEAVVIAVALAPLTSS